MMKKASEERQWHEQETRTHRSKILHLQMVSPIAYYILPMIAMD